MDRAAGKLENLEIHRWKLPDWDGLHPPGRKGGDWGVTLPDAHFANLFDRAFPEVGKNPWRPTSKDGRATYLRGCDEETIERIRTFLEVLFNCVVISDHTDGAFALDFTAEQDNQGEWGRTKIGELVYAAKPYDSAPTADSCSAAVALAKLMAAFVKTNPVIEIDAVVAVAPSKPTSSYRLPVILGEGIADHLGLPFLDVVEKVSPTPSIKNLCLSEKLQALSGSIRVSRAVRGRRVLLVDDLYQSGITLNYVTELLREAGATRVFGLAAVKTMRNDDNTARGED